MKKAKSSGGFLILLVGVFSLTLHDKLKATNLPISLFCAHVLFLVLIVKYPKGSINISFTLINILNKNKLKVN